ncbi:hypothetical protein L5515_003932 [Caenorhabditis briggsae]|uniref:Uncharacterized protein n=1 Tax=Caenorhabditis briggsae TaxID=6238 RepID=A0AAE9EIT7_CAEBR|nr:hypothetical protein L3Y34_001079 [Caenorhabditis briggsae]UMM23005.1 hypothetical protein L5515_003932 [Caenorhabditis briggsae]
MSKAEELQPISESFKDFGTTDLSHASLSIRKWMKIGYRLYGNMLDNSDYSFFLSFPHFISQLSFLMSICQEKTTGLRTEFGWSSTSGELALQVQHKNLMEITQKFMKTWKNELNQSSKPGHIKTARRILCHPTCAVSFHLKTLECLRRYFVELKLFEGAEEHRAWIRENLEKNFERQTVVNVWDEESLNDDVDSVDMETKPAEEGNNAVELAKKSPILMWISYANVAIRPDIFDVKFLYTLKDTVYFRVAATPNLAIRERESEMPWHSIVLPCVKPDLCFVLIYNFSRNLCSYEELRVHIDEQFHFAPCIVRKCERKLSATTPMVEKRKENIYFPYWGESDFHPNRFAERLQKIVDIDETFTEGGFGDLAFPSAIPSPGGSMYKVGHLQNFSILNFHNSPSTRIPAEDCNADAPTKRNIQESEDNEIVPYPFCAILWDTNRHVPVYMGKITGKNPSKNMEPAKGGLWKWLSRHLKPKS